VVTTARYRPAASGGSRCLRRWRGGRQQPVHHQLGGGEVGRQRDGVQVAQLQQRLDVVVALDDYLS
jgi:hypothetical protein